MNGIGRPLKMGLRDRCFSQGKTLEPLFGTPFGTQSRGGMVKMVYGNGRCIRRVGEGGLPKGE